MSVADRSFRIAGGRVGFLLFHGLAGTPVELRFVARSLAASGYTVHCPQIVGHCGTSEDLKATRWTDWLAGAEASLVELRKECDTVIVGGTSMGAVLALELAARRPDSVHALSLFAPTLWLNGWAMPWHTRLFKLVTQDWCADLFNFERRKPFGIKDERVRAFLVGAMQSGASADAGLFAAPGRSVLELRRLVRDVKPRLASISQPALIIHPREDDLSSLANAQFLQRSLGGVVQTCVLDDCYHMVALDRQRDLLVERTKAFAKWAIAHIEEPAQNVVRMPGIAAE